MKFFCISLDYRTDRREKMNIIFNKYNIPINYLIVKKHINSIKGCFESHIKIWENAIKNYNDDEDIIVFEDDVVVTQELTIKEFYDILDDAKKLLKHYDIVHLGRTVYDCFGEIKRNKKWRFYNGKVLCAHLYVINVKNMKRVINKVKRHIDNMHFDFAIRDECNQVFLYPNIFQQKDFYDSDNKWCKSQKMDKFLRFAANVIISMEDVILFTSPPLCMLAKKIRYNIK